MFGLTVKESLIRPVETPLRSLALALNVNIGVPLSPVTYVPSALLLRTAMQPLQETIAVAILGVLLVISALRGPVVGPVFPVRNYPFVLILVA